jgi:hypothetical protein
MNSEERSSELRPKPILRDVSQNTPQQHIASEGNSLLRSRRPPETDSRINVEYWNKGEKTQIIHEAPRYRRNRSFKKRADQFGILILLGTAVLLSLVFLGIYLSGRSEAHKPSAKASGAGGKIPETTTSMDISLKEGNRVFNQVFAEEKALKKGDSSLSGSKNNGMVQELGISAQEQLKIMERKTREIRSMMSEDNDEMSQSMNASTQKDPIKPQPVKLRNFSAPMEFNSMLSKPLQQTNLP